MTNTPTDARKFYEWLAKKADGKVKLREVRLPGKAEWEFACRAGGTGRFSFGDDKEKLAEHANVADATWNERFPNPKTAFAYGDDPEVLSTAGNVADATARAKFLSWTLGIKAKDGHAFTAPVGLFKKNALGLHDMHGNVWESRGLVRP